MKRWHGREAPMARCFIEAKIILVLDSSTTLQTLNMNFMNGKFFYFI